jgi:DNA-binding Xre family transcriptional regulator
LTASIFRDRVSYVVTSEEVITVAKIVSKALQARLQYQLKMGRKVPLSEVAERAGVDRGALTRLEQGNTERFDGDMMAKLCKFYEVGLEALLEYDPNAIQTLELMGAGVRT